MLHINVILFLDPYLGSYKIYTYIDIIIYITSSATLEIIKNMERLYEYI